VSVELIDTYAYRGERGGIIPLLRVLKKVRAWGDWSLRPEI